MSLPYLHSVSHGLPAAVRLWWVDLDTYANLVPLQGLEAADVERAGRMSSRRQGLRFLAARHALNGLLVRALGASDKHLRLHVNEFGKPELPGGGLEFNLSHSEGEALVAVSERQPVGVDIEQVRPVVDAEALVHDHFTEAERGYWSGGGTDATRDRRFLECWTGKEACLKALGVGLSIPPATIDAGQGDTVRAVSLSLGADRVDVSVCSVHASPTTVAAVALATAEVVALARRRMGAEAEER